MNGAYDELFADRYTLPYSPFARALMIQAIGRLLRGGVATARWKIFAD